MEDQPADSGDLTAGSAVPEGKAARRHRLPRQKVDPAATVAEPDVAEPDVVEPDVAEPDVAEPDAAADAEVEAAAEPVDPAEPVPAAPQRRSRFAWRKAKAGDTPEPTSPDPLATETHDEATESGLGVDEADAPDVESAPESEPVLVPHRTAPRALKIAAVAAGALFVGAAAFAGATLQPYLADRAAVHTKFEIAQISANAITTLWTYTPDDMDTLPDRADKYLGGDFAVAYRRYIDSIVEPNKQAQISNDTQVLGAAVEELSPTEATALVYTNSVATTPVTKGIPSLKYLSYRLSLERRNSEWRITSMTAVTSLDLTPRL